MVDDRDIAGRLPPHALDAEAAVLSTVLLAHERGTPELRAAIDRALDIARPEHFYSPANEWIRKAIDALRAEGTPIDVVTVASWLRGAERLAEVGGAPYLAQVADATPAVAHVETHALIVLETWRVRATIATCQRVAAEGYGDVGSVGDFITGAHAEIGDIVRTAPPREPTRTGLAAMLAAPVPVTSWICEGLQWCPGRPPVIIGYPGAGKTLAVLSAAVSLMLGRPIFGSADFRPAHACRVLHVDFDQGKAPTQKRIRRLLAGMSVTEADIATARAEVENRRGEPCADLLEVETDPRLRLMADKVNAKAVATFEAAWCRAVEGFDVVIVDSLRKLAPLLEENDSRFGEVPEALRRVSERMGVTIILVHHAGRRGTDRGKPLTEAGRGSSAIDGAAGSQLVIEPDGNALRRVTLTRESAEADRPPPEPFCLELVWLRQDDGRPVGYRLEHRPAEQANPPESQRARSSASDPERKILDALRRNPGEYKSASAVASAAKVNKGMGLATVKRLEEHGEIVRQPCGRCDGTGSIARFDHHEGGECFGCHGSGRAGYALPSGPPVPATADVIGPGSAVPTVPEPAELVPTVPAPRRGAEPEPEPERGRSERAASDATEAIRAALASGAVPSLDALRLRVPGGIPLWALRGAWDGLRAGGEVVRVGSGRSAPWGLAPTIAAAAGEPPPPSTAPP